MKTPSHIESLMNRPVFRIVGKNSKATIGRIYRPRSGHFTVRFHSRMVDETFETTADALAWVSKKTNRQVVAI